MGVYYWCTYTASFVTLLILNLIRSIPIIQLRGEFIQGSSSQTDTSQLQQSRIGLVSQAVLLLFTVVFIFSDSLGDFWKDK